MTDMYAVALISRFTRYTLPLLGLSSVGCTSPSEIPNTCSGTTQRALQACVASSEVPSEGLDLNVEFEASGAVVAVGQDSPPTNCFEADSFVGGGPEPSPDDSLSWFQVDDGAEIKTVAVRAAGVALPINNGDTLTISYRISGGAFSRLTGDLQVFHDDDLVVYVGSGNSLAELTLPAGLDVALGEPVCQSDGPCGTVKHRELAASFGGARGSIAPGSAGEVGGLLVHNGILVTAEGVTTCQDAANAGVNLLVERR